MHEKSFKVCNVVKRAYFEQKDESSEYWRGGAVIVISSDLIGAIRPIPDTLPLFAL